VAVRHRTVSISSVSNAAEPVDSICVDGAPPMLKLIPWLSWTTGRRMARFEGIRALGRKGPYRRKRGLPGRAEKAELMMLRRSGKQTECCGRERERMRGECLRCRLTGILRWCRPGYFLHGQCNQLTQSSSSRQRNMTGGTGPQKQRRRERAKLRIDEAGLGVWVGEGKPGTMGRESRDRCRKRCREEESGQLVFGTSEGW